MRVAHLLPTLEIGGRERTVLDLARNGRQFGITPLIVTHDRPVAGRACFDPGDLPVLALDHRSADYRGSLRTALGERRIDVLHAHGHVTAIHAAGAGVASLATLHVALGGGWRSALPIRAALRRMDRLTAVSDDLARRFARLSGRAVESVPTAVDAFRPRTDRGAPSGILEIGMVARLHPVKRHRDAIQAMTCLTRLGVAARLSIAGDGPLATDLRRLAKGRSDVRLLGAVADIPAFLSGLDAFLLCSEHEGTPLALLEAMASGLPCIATAVGGVPAIAGPAQAVLLVPPRRPASIACALAGLVRPEIRMLHGEAARARARCYTYRTQVARYDALYREAISATHSRQS